MSFLFPSSTITFDAAMRDLGSGSAKARAMAAHALGGVTDIVEKRRAVDALVRALDDDRPEVRGEACASLGELREPGALPHLIKRLADGAAMVRQSAAIALGTIAHADGFAPLVESLQTGPADLRYQAATSLAEIDPARALEPVLAALGDADPQVVGAAALSVGAIGERDRERCIAALMTKLDHTDPGARFEVAYALAELNDPAGKASLAAMVTDPGRAWDAVTALGWIAAEAELRAAVTNRKVPPEAQLLAAGCLLGVAPDDAAAQKLLIDALTSRKPHLRGLAIEQLGETGGPWAKQPLERLARAGKGGEHLEAIATTLRAIEERWLKAMKP
ncbi:MAG: HEAT repeat domain-containing protein [Deltaproteobacteria bacterium]|nr:HEAT repeat domain-containing protein [Deltaproteobacteria bacterium]